ncbi:hypothetical protein ACNI65_08900 [Roseateles sp. So40a]|uniref:hypothetical protein n=1 Tax=Roseateles sp. So40a TaxID=3400226 RepID=UPI003A8BBEE4
MGKQLSILATDVDLQALEDIMREMEDVDILSDVANADLMNLLPLEDLTIPLSQVGKASLFCYLAPRYLARSIVVERDSPVKVHIDLRKSCLIEFWRPFYDGNVMRYGRMYYHKQHRSVERDPAFVAWADSVMTRVRRSLKLDKNLGAYVGSDAAKKLAGREVSVVG